MKRVGFLFLCLLSLTGCATITGQLEIDWQGNGEIGATVLVPSNLYKQIKPWIPSLEQAFEKQGYHTESVQIGDQNGFRFFQTLEELSDMSAQVSSHNRTPETSGQSDWGTWFADWFADHFTITTDDTFFYQDVTVDGDLDFRNWPLLSLPFFQSVSPKLEFTLPVIPEHNADEVIDDHTLRWNLSWDEQHPVYVHVRVWKIPRLIVAGGVTLLLLVLLYRLYRKRVTL